MYILNMFTIALTHKPLCQRRGRHNAYWMIRPN